MKKRKALCQGSNRQGRRVGDKIKCAKCGFPFSVSAPGWGVATVPVHHPGQPT